MVSVYKIQVAESVADQVLDTVLDDTPVSIRLLWNDRHSYWSISVYKDIDTPLIINRRVVPQYPLVQAYQKVGLRGDLYVLNESGKTGYPNISEMGVNGGYNLYYIDTEDAESFPSSQATVGFTATLWDSEVIGGPTSWDVVGQSGNTIWV